MQYTNIHMSEKFYFLLYQNKIIWYIFIKNPNHLKSINIFLIPPFHFTLLDTLLSTPIFNYELQTTTLSHTSQFLSREGSILW